MESTSTEFSRYELAQNHLEINRSRLPIKQAWIKKLDYYLRFKLDREAAWVALRNKAASNTKEIREIASFVREQIAQQTECPYCGGPLGIAPHVDHIYPVSKGGLSMPRNLVYVCVECNTKKIDLTLTAFIKKFKLNREVVEQRLEHLNKDF